MPQRTPKEHKGPTKDPQRTGKDSGAQVDVIYTDFAKAFDTVPHGRLLTKLKTYNTSGFKTSSVIEYKAYVLTVSFLLGLM